MVFSTANSRSRMVTKAGRFNWDDERLPLPPVSFWETKMFDGLMSAMHQPAFVGMLQSHRRLTDIIARLFDRQRSALPPPFSRG